MNAPTVRWAVVGTGAVSRSVVPDFALCEGAHVTLVQSRDPLNAAAFAADFGIPRSTSDYAAVVDDDSVDAVYLATPFATHHAMTLKALTAGKHVLVEKPMATTATEVAELFDAAARNSVFLMEGMWMKFSPVYRRLHHQIATGVIGEPRNLRAAFSFPFPRDGGSRWDIKRSGSTLLDQGIYPVTLAHSVFGLPTAIQASGTVREDGVDLAEHFTLEFGGGRFAQCASGMTEFSDPSAAVSGERGWISIPAPFWAGTSLVTHAGSSETLFRNPPHESLPHEGHGYVPMLRAATRAIQEGLGEHPTHPARDTLEVFSILDEIRRRIAEAEHDPQASTSRSKEDQS